MDDDAGAARRGEAVRELVEEVIEAEAPLIRMPEPPFPDTNRFEITTPLVLLAQTPLSRKSRMTLFLIVTLSKPPVSSMPFGPRRSP